MLCKSSPLLVRQLHVTRAAAPPRLSGTDPVRATTFTPETPPVSTLPLAVVSARTLEPAFLGTSRNFSALLADDKLQSYWGKVIAEASRDLII